MEGNCGNHEDVLRRVRALEYQVVDLNKKMQAGEVCDAETKADIKNLSKDFESLKVDILGTVREHTDKTWKLIDKGLKIIIVLVIFILAIVGVKVGPEILKFLGG